MLANARKMGGAALGDLLAPQLRSRLRMLLAPAFGRRNLAGGQPLASTHFPRTVGTRKGLAAFELVDSSNTFLVAPTFPGTGIPFLSAGDDFTVFGYYPRTRSPFDGNPALWRTVNTFCIFNGTTGWPWIRINATDITGTPTGDRLSAGTELSVVMRVRSAATWEVWWNGVLRQSGTHAVATVATNITEFGNHSISQALGNFAWAAAWNYALPPAWCLELSRRPESMWVTQGPTIYSLPSAGVSFKPAWARNANVILQPGAL